MNVEVFYFAAAVICLVLTIWLIVLFAGLCENVKELVYLERRKQGVRLVGGKFKRIDENGDVIK